jgi:N-acyl-D-aspartate/D-glutamate deacylase
MEEDMQNGTLDLVVRGGLVMDGLGGTPMKADVGVLDGRIVEIGDIHARGNEEIDARGKIVTPGFVDIHTHYDGQVMWSPRLTPSSWHGVTTAVMGNCGVGFAPVRTEDRERLIELMEGVEDIPGVALHEGLDWAWESFPQFMDAMERLPHDIDFCAQVPHAPLRVYVMGERASRLEQATPQDIARMRELTTEAVLKGAIGFSTSRSINHRSATGDPMPSLRAAEEELTQIALGLRDAGKGVLEIIIDFDDPEMLDAEFGMMRRLVEVSGRPLSFSLMQKHGNKEGWRRLLELTAEAVAQGLPIRAQVAPRGIGVLIGLQGSRNVFSDCPGYKAIAQLSLEERVRRMKEPALREQLLRELDEVRNTPLGRRLTHFANMFPLGDPPCYDPGADGSIAAHARRDGVDPAALVYDYQLQDGGRAILFSPFANYAYQDLSACGDMIADPNTVIGLGDGGAHVGLISDSNFPTFLLSHWGRGKGTREFELPWLIKRHTSDTARAVGLLDRGVLAEGMKADINVIDMDVLDPGLPEMHADLPAGKGRYLQQPTGYVATIVSGAVVYRDGRPTDALPGRLVRSQS